MKNKKKALSQHLHQPINFIEANSWFVFYCPIGEREQRFLVLTPTERTKALNKALRDSFEEQKEGLSEYYGTKISYTNWLLTQEVDAGQYLSSFDGSEYTELVNGKTYYIYRCCQ
jgi:hypothetical protein